MKLLGIACLIFLASVGMGIAGGMTIPVVYRKEDAIELITEQKETADVEKEDLNLLKK